MGYENPLLDLPSARKVLALPPEQRQALEELMRDLRAKSDQLAEESWRKRKGPMAAYWRAVSTYARHIAHALSKGETRPERASNGAGAQVVSVDPAAVREAVRAAASALHFADSSDYERALWTVLRSLAPEVHQAVECGDARAVFDDQMNLLWRPGQDDSDRDGAGPARRERQR